MKKHLLIFIFLAFFSALAEGQPTLDTIRQCMKMKPKLYGKFDTRDSFIDYSRAKIAGVKGGVSFGKRVFIGLGYNQLYSSSSAFNKELYFPGISKTDSVPARLHLVYFSLQAEYIFYRTGHWTLSMPLQIGAGKTYYTYYRNNRKYRTDESFNFIYEPAVSVEYKFFSWLGVGADIGYRFMITSDRKVNSNFTSPTYAFKLLIYYGELYKALFPRTKLAQKL